MGLRAPLLALCLAALCLVVFAPALSGGFLLWDDAELLLSNARWRGFAPDQLRWMFTTLHLGPYQPLSWLSYALDHALWGLDPHAFHRTNLVLHAGSTVLCFLCARELFAQRWAERRGSAALDLGAAAAAALFALHPLRVESVAWITERRDVLSGFFLLLSLRAWLADAKKLALLGYAASLLAKASALGWPLVLVALELWLRAKPGWRAKLPYFALSISFGIVALLGQAALPGTLLGWGEHGLVARLAQAAYGWLFYPLQTVAVVGVRPFYDLELPLPVGEPRFVAALVLAPLALGAAFLARKRWPGVWTALLSYTLLVAPLLGLSQAGAQLVAARYSYLACIPLALLAGAALAQLPRGAALAGLLLALLPGWRANLDTRAWQSDRALWTRARELDPSSRVALRNLVAAEYAAGRFDEGLALCDQWARLREDPEQWNARGSLLAAKGESEAALAALRRSLERSTVAEPNLVALLVRLGRAREALPVCQAWTARSPGDAAAWAALGRVQTELGAAQPALAALERALELDRDLSGAWVDRGLVLAALGRREEARAAFREALAVRARLDDGAAEHPDAREARLQLEHLQP